MKKNGEFRSVGGVLLILLLGKCLSLAANQAYLSFFGAENERLNIFSWALQIPGYLFQSAGTALVSVVIPVYASLRATGREREAGRFASNLLSVCTLFAALVCAAGLCLSAVLPELTEFQDRLTQAVGVRASVKGTLNKGRIVLPYASYEELESIYEAISRLLD